MKENPLQHLNALLNLVGLRAKPASTKRNKDHGKTYFYQLSQEHLNRVNEVIVRQKAVSAWDFINTTYGFDPTLFDWEYWEFTRQKRRIL